MENCTIVNPSADMHGARKENVFVALDENKKTLGLILIYPFFDHDIEPEHPHNLYLHLHIEAETEQKEAIKEMLLEKALQRAAEIKSEAGQTKTRVYAAFLKNQQDGIDFYLKRGFTHDEGMHILERNKTADLSPMDEVQGVSIQPWRMETEAEQQQFIETHKKIFPRHAYSVESLQELMSLPAWNNFTAFDDDEIAGNIMVHIKPEDGSIGIIEDLFVPQKWRRRGIARNLLTTALTYFQDLGVHRVQLELWSANKNAFQLYRSFGFSSIDETEIAVGRYV